VGISIGWGKSFGGAWGASFGFLAEPADVGGGGPGGNKGWANERALLESRFALPKEIEAARVVLADSDRPVVKRAAKKIYDYSQDLIAIGTLERELGRLDREITTRQNLSEDIQSAAAIMRQYLQDEQDALDLLLLTTEQDAAELLAAIGILT
jgi:hypothetical protein